MALVKSPDSILLLTSNSFNCTYVKERKSAVVHCLRLPSFFLDMHDVIPKSPKPGWSAP